MAVSPRVWTATEKSMSVTWVLNLETGNKWKPDERSPQGLGNRESIDNRYDGSPEESVW